MRISKGIILSTAFATVLSSQSAAQVPNAPSGLRWRIEEKTFSIKEMVVKSDEKYYLLQFEKPVNALGFGDNTRILSLKSLTRAQAFQESRQPTDVRMQGIYEPLASDQIQKLRTMIANYTGAKSLAPGVD